MRQPPNPRNHAIREFILGAILVLAIQVIVGVLDGILFYGTIAIVSVFRIQTNSPLFILMPTAPALFIGITQIAYLAPWSVTGMRTRSRSSPRRRSSRLSRVR